MASSESTSGQVADPSEIEERKFYALGPVFGSLPPLFRARQPQGKATHAAVVALLDHIETRGCHKKEVRAILAACQAVGGSAGCCVDSARCRSRSPVHESVRAAHDAGQSVPQRKPVIAMRQKGTPIRATLYIQAEEAEKVRAYARQANVSERRALRFLITAGLSHLADKEATRSRSVEPVAKVGSGALATRQVVGSQTVYIDVAFAALAGIFVAVSVAPWIDRNGFHVAIRLPVGRSRLRRRLLHQRDQAMLRAWIDEVVQLVDRQGQFEHPHVLSDLGYRRPVLLLLLSRSDFGLTVFLSVEAGKPLQLRHGFVFWPKELSVGKHSQADVYFTVASVLQNLRAKSASPTEKQALRSNWFQQSLLAPGNFGRYNDGIIQASLLRAASPSELNYAMSKDASAEVRRIIQRILTSFSTTRGEGSVEFLLALACGRMTLAPDDLGKIVEAKGLPPILALLAAVAKRRLQ